jgi:hypothetical protein
MRRLIHGRKYSSYTFSQMMQDVIDNTISSGLTLPSNKFLIAMDVFLIEIYNAGVYDRLDELFMFKHDSDIHFSGINFINPEFVITHNGLTHNFTPNEGYHPIQIGIHYDGNFNNHTEPAAKYKLGDACSGGVIGDYVSITGGFSLVMANPGPNNTDNDLWVRETAYRTYMQQGGGYTQHGTAGNMNIVVPGELRCMTRNVNQQRHYRDGNLMRGPLSIGYTGTASTYTSTDVNYHVNFIRNDNSSVKHVQMIFKGGFLTDAQVMSLRNAWENYKLTTI